MDRFDQRLRFWTAISRLLRTGVALQGAVRAQARGAPFLRAGGCAFQEETLFRFPADVARRAHGRLAGGRRAGRGSYRSSTPPTHRSRPGSRLVG
jgi:hypothetical protein